MAAVAVPTYILAKDPLHTRNNTMAHHVFFNNQVVSTYRGKNASPLYVNHIHALLQSHTCTCDVKSRNTILLVSFRAWFGASLSSRVLWHIKYMHIKEDLATQLDP